MLWLVTKWFHLIGSENKLFLTLSIKNEFFTQKYTLRSVFIFNKKEMLCLKNLL